MSITPHQACYYAHELTRLGATGELQRLSTTLFDSKVDLNPHQVDAALFALSNPLRKGVILADEVGLGKTIEAGLVLCQKWAERKRRLVVVTPAHIRKQWQTELAEKFNLPSIVIDRKAWNTLRRDGNTNPFDIGKIIVISYGFAARMKDDLRAIPFDLVVFDEAHKLRNAYQPSRAAGQAIRWAFELRQKLLLTATPLQNSLLELYGLAWLIDDHIFGDRASFQSRYANATGDLSGLRDRLGDFCMRTLRKDCPYINYRERHAMTHTFAQTAEEKSLHLAVMEFMQQDISFAFPQRQRHLIEMILFKTLASSSQALASTLKTIRKRLVAIRDGQQPETEIELLDTINQDQDIDLEDISELIDGLTGDSDIPAGPVQGRLLAMELMQVDQLIDRASNLGTDSKAQALLQALKAGFDRMVNLGAARKALIFTESRRTQDFLAAYLEANGYADKVVTFNGSNTGPIATKAYERFMAKHADSDRVTGSKAVDVRSALIEEFRDHAEILLATEAGAEGVNLQFCSLVVNYDLPWNPQRIEQRIGRCHRYGQQHDVVVVNFLSQDNLADRRVQELLQQKFNLFDGLFGASDEVLGAIEEGVDFEKRVMEILKTCRTNEEIQQAFDTLQRDLETTISQRMAQARQHLFEHFDADVHERLKISGDHARLVLDRVGERFWRLTRWGLSGQATFDDNTLSLDLTQAIASHVPTGKYRLISAARSQDDASLDHIHLLRLSSPLGKWVLNKARYTELPTNVITFDVTHNPRKVSMLGPLVGQSGWLRLEKLSIDAEEAEEYLLFTGVMDNGENIDQEQAGRLMDVIGQITGSVDVSVNWTDRLGKDAERLVESTLSRVSETSNQRLRQARRQVDQWADDKIASAEAKMNALRLDVRTARRHADQAPTVREQEECLARVQELDSLRRKARLHIDEVEEEVEERREKILQELRVRCAQKHRVQTLFTVRFRVS